MDVPDQYFKLSLACIGGDAMLDDGLIQDHVPTPLATGNGDASRRAREAGVAVHRDRELVTRCSRLDVGTLIPPDHYGVVAEVLAYVYRLEVQLGPPGPDAG